MSRVGRIWSMKSDRDIPDALRSSAASEERHLLILRKPVAPPAAPAAFPAFGNRSRRQRVAARGYPARRRVADLRCCQFVQCMGKCVLPTAWVSENALLYLRR
jgi:hypothetical protein